MALVEGCKHSIEITVPVAEVEKETERVVAEIQKKARLPGFRPGHAPLSIVKTRFAGEIRQDVLEKLVPRFFQAAVEKDHLKVVGRPDVTDVHFHAGEPLKFKAEFEVAPEFELGEYRGISIPYDEPKVSDEDVNERLEALRQQRAEFVNEEPRPLADGDYALVSLESLSGLAEKIQQDEISFKIGDEATLPAFTENLRGASPEESREFEVTYPEDYDRKNLAGKTVKFRATVKAVRRKELPELNDEFAKDLGDYQTLEELKTAVRSAILREREQRAQEEAKEALLNKLVEQHDFPLPDAYIDRQIEINVDNQLRTLAAQGIDPKSIKLDWNKVRESQKDKAARDVKASLLLDKIAEREAINATQEEVDREVQRIARQQREAVAVTRAKLQKDGAIARIAGHIRTEKTLNFLFEQARKEAPARPES
ncbi:MAG TPA: trigger factor [Bryobacteraceae bacterium]|jgi:trigger factor|nr:trigger factor [Bryobacteraceae bacterium]